MVVMCALVWVIAVFGAAALGEAARIAGQRSGGRAAGLIVVLVAVGFVGGFVGVAVAP